MKKYKFIKHKYIVKCDRCGWERKCNDDNVVGKCVLVKIGFCDQCCPNGEGRGWVVCYDKDGNKLI